MVDKTLRSLGRSEEKAAVDAAVCTRRRWRRPVGRANRLLLMLLIQLQFVDILSTNHALAMPGVWEANPLMAWSQAKLGAAWWLPKLVPIALIAAMAPLSRRRWPIVAMVSVSCLAVLINFTHF